MKKENKHEFNYEKKLIVHLYDKKIDILKYLKQEDVEFLNKFSINIENRLYTGNEFENIEIQLYNVIAENSNDSENINIKQKCNEILDIFNRIAIEYKI